jgi:hypothetical protein
MPNMPKYGFFFQKRAKINLLIKKNKQEIKEKSQIYIQYNKNIIVGHLLFTLK